MGCYPFLHEVEWAGPMSLDLVEDRPHYVAEVANDVDDGGDFTAATDCSPLPLPQPPNGF